MISDGTARGSQTAGLHKATIYKTIRYRKEKRLVKPPNLYRHQLDLYLSCGARSCADRELGVSSLDRRKNELRTISISPVGSDLN